MKIQELQKYLHYEFSTGAITGEDYKTFERKYISYLKGICKQNNWEFIRANKNHYCFSAFLKANGKYIYLSIDDVRFWTNNWYKQILIRLAKNDRDYIGGRNCYTNLESLETNILKLTQ